MIRYLNSESNRKTRLVENEAEYVEIDCSDMSEDLNLFLSAEIDDVCNEAEQRDRVNGVNGIFLGVLNDWLHNPTYITCS